MGAVLRSNGGACTYLDKIDLQRNIHLFLLKL